MSDEEGCIFQLVILVVILVLISSAISWAVTTVSNIVDEIVGFFQGIWEQIVIVFQQITEYFENLEGPDLGDIPPPDDDDSPNPIECEYMVESSEMSNLSIGDQAIVQNTIGQGLACRVCPGRQDSSPEVWLENGSVVLIENGPVSVSQDDWLWWQVHTQDSSVCWAAEDVWLAPLTEVSTPPVTPSVFPSGNVITGYAIVTNTGGEALRCRSEPRLNSDVVTRLAEGTEVIVFNSPISADGFEWWFVRVSDGSECWVAANWLTFIPTVTSTTTATSTPTATPTSTPTATPTLPIPGITPVPPIEKCYEGAEFGVTFDENGAHHYVEFHVTDIPAGDLEDYTWFIDEAPPTGADWNNWGWVRHQDGVGRAGFPWPSAIPYIFTPENYTLCGILN